MLSWVFRINGNVVINLSTPTGRDMSSKQQIQLTECLLDSHTKGVELSWPSSLEAASLKITWCSWFLRIPGLRSADLISKGAGNVLAEPRTIKQGLPRVINYSLFNAQDWQRCQLFNLIREILCKRRILVKFCSLSFTSGFILSISQTNTLNLFSQKSSHVDKLFHVAYLHLSWKVPSNPSLAGWDTHCFPEFPKGKTSQSRGVKGHQPPSSATSPSTSIPQILPLHFTHRMKSSVEKLLKTGAENSIRQEEQINSLHWGFKAINSTDNFCINHRFWHETEIIFSLEGFRH